MKLSGIKHESYKRGRREQACLFRLVLMNVISYTDFA